VSRISPRSVVIVTCFAALVVFAVVQDRVTAAGARRYVTQQREAIAGRDKPVTIEEVMDPAIQRSVQRAAVWGGLVLVAGLALAASLRGNTRE
jgi:hypothetical protein